MNENQFQSYSVENYDYATPEGRQQAVQAARMRQQKRVRQMRLRIGMIVTGSVAIVVLAIVVIYLVTNGQTNNGNASAPKAVQNSAPAVSDIPQAVQQPPSAADVAKKLNCTNFKDLGGSTKGSGFQGILDGGSCYIGGEKYAINTFVNKSVRDSWLSLATHYGVVPKWETATSVTYPSVTDGQ